MSPSVHVVNVEHRSPLHHMPRLPRKRSFLRRQADCATSTPLIEDFMRFAPPASVLCTTFANTIPFHDRIVSTMARPRCFFLELPPELRLHIYSYLVKPETIEIYSFWSGRPYIWDMPEVAASLFHAVTTPSGPMHGLDPNILRTCRLIHQEAQPLLYQPVSLHLRPSIYEDKSKMGEPYFHPSKLRNIRSLSTLQVHLLVLTDSFKEDLEHMRLLMPCLSSKLEVGTLSIHIEDEIGTAAFFDRQEKGMRDTVLAMLAIIGSTVKAKGYQVERKDISPWLWEKSFEDSWTGHQIESSQGKSD
jgi:hypothetical protein